MKTKQEKTIMNIELPTVIHDEIRVLSEKESRSMRGFVADAVSKKIKQIKEDTE